MKRAFGQIAIWAVLGACTPSTPNTPKVVEAPKAVPLGLTRATTDGVRAITNLGAQIEGRTAHLARQPALKAVRSSLVSARLTRASFLGAFDEFDAVSTLLKDLDPKDPARAPFLSAVHRFDDAAQLYPPNSPGLDTILLAQGQDLDGVLIRRRARAETNPSFRSLTELAAILAGLGRYDAADQAYLSALAAYRDVSPFPVAWVAFQRGRMWAEMADMPSRAIPLYEEAVRRLPGYVVAHVHLAELLSQTDRARAIELLKAVVDTADPEPAGLLGRILKSPDLIKRAATRYDTLLRTHREAFLDHAAEFFIGPGHDKKRGLTLALENLTLRDTDRARIVAIEAALAANATQTLCKLDRDGPNHSTALAHLRDRIKAMCP